MYRAFRINADNQNADKLRSVLNLDESEMREQAKPDLKAKLSKMIHDSSLTTKTTKKLEAESIWDEWFPQVKADVFISHSSKDAALAKLLASWLEQYYQLTAFIDSEIWGHSDELLKKLDDEYCVKDRSNGRATIYSYEKRNNSTAHVHMLLCSALTRMIERTECFIFIESHNSVTAKDSVEGTYSPWIFHELATVDTVELKVPERLKDVVVAESVDLGIKYPLPGRRLIEINGSILSQWQDISVQKQQVHPQVHPLDILYQKIAAPEGGH